MEWLWVVIVIIYVLTFRVLVIVLVASVHPLRPIQVVCAVILEISILRIGGGVILQGCGSSAGVMKGGEV